MDTRDAYHPKTPARITPPRDAAPMHATAEASPSAERPSRSLSLRFVIGGVLRYWWQILLIWAAGSAAMVGWVHVNIKPEYEAFSLLRAEPAPTVLVGIPVNSGDGLELFLGTQVQLMTSTNVLSEAVRDKRVAQYDRISKADDPALAVRRALKVGAIPGTTLIRVGMTSTSPSEAADVVNAVVHAYIKANEEWTHGMTQGQISALTLYLDDLKNQTAQFEKEWIRLVAEGNADPQILPPGGAGNKADREAVVTTVEEYRTVQQQLFQTRLDLIKAEAALERRKSEAATHMDPQLQESRQVDDGLATDPELVAAAADLRRCQKALEDVKRLSRRRDDPSVLAKARRLEEVQGRYNTLYNVKREALKKTAEALAVAKPDHALKDAEEHVAVLRGQKESYEKALDEIQVARKKDATFGVQIQLVREARDVTREMQTAVHRRLEQLQFDSKSQSRIRLSDLAQVPMAPVSDTRHKKMLMMPLGLLGVLVGLALLVEFRSGRVMHPDELTALAPVEAYAIPPLPSLSMSRRGKDQAMLIEEFAQRLDHLRVGLGLDVVTGVGRCVMVTSATGGEGKTTLSAQLAGRCASAGVRTLLIDADLRRATLSRMLEVPDGPGLLDVLDGQADAETAMVTIAGSGNLTLLPAGNGGQDPNRVLRGVLLGQMLERLRQQFELIIIDTPPVLPVPDALTIGQWIDGALVATRSEMSRSTQVGRAVRMLRAARVPMLGIVVNGVRISHGGESKYAYAYYSREREKKDDVPGTL